MTAIIERVPGQLPAPHPTWAELERSYRRSPTPILVGQHPKVIDQVTVSLADSGNPPCRCGHHGHVWGYAVSCRVHSDRRGKRALKTAGAIAAFAIIGFGARRRQFADITYAVGECPVCGAINSPDLGISWRVLDAAARLELAKELN